MTRAASIAPSRDAERATDPAAPILEVRGLTIGLPAGSDRSTAVRDVSFEVGRGEILCLVGESGSGKSVIAQSVMGLLPRTLPVARRQHPAAGRRTHRRRRRRACVRCARPACR